MNQKLVFIVEDDPMMSRLFSSILRANGANFIIAHNIEDATSLFRTNKKSITHILLDGSLTPMKIGVPFPTDPETLPLAKEIASTEEFLGVVYPMSSMPDYITILLQTLGSKGIFLGYDLTKIDIARAVIEQIKK